MTLQLRSLTHSLIAIAAIAGLSGAHLVAGQTETIIHSFGSGSNRDGAYPSGGLVADTNGALYGLTTGGGADGPGAAFKLSPPANEGGVWKQNIVYSFTDTADGGVPYGNLLFSMRNHSMYGTASRGGALYGVVFQLTPPTRSGGAWTETVLHTFTGGKDGEFPQSGVISNTRGTLYGTTPSGGKYQSGVVFRLSPPNGSGKGWTESVLYSFTAGSDGGSPSGLVMDGTGALYGTTAIGGQFGHGTVFTLTPPAGGSGPWTESILYNFTGGSDGGDPLANLIFDSAGALYGTTVLGGAGSCSNSDGVVTYCGTVFKLTPPGTQGGAWTENVLYAFLAGTDGAFPATGLAFDSTGSLYGTAAAGLFGSGIVFKLSPPLTQGDPWTEQILHAFAGGTDGANPQSGLLQLGASFYGTTWDGGSLNTGTIFQVTP